MTREITKKSEAIASELHSAAIHLLRKLRREDDSSGLNAPRLSALSVVVFGGPLTLGALAQAEQVRAPTMTRIVHALVEQGLVVRSASEIDGRTTILTATASGRAVLMAGRERRVRALARQIADLSAEERQVLESATTILRRVIEGV
jgi:DNA-binding MarR family transcriptional regulator